MESRDRRHQKAKGFCEICFSVLILGSYQRKLYIIADNNKFPGPC